MKTLFNFVQDLYMTLRLTLPQKYVNGANKEASLHKRFVKKLGEFAVGAKAANLRWSNFLWTTITRSLPAAAVGSLVWH